MTTSGVSVVVPTRDRPGPLAACLRALAKQTLAPTEIVVVDDASTDPRAVAAVVAAVPGARLVRGEGRGPAAARNVGAAAAIGEVICFTDDDCRPEPGWLAALTARLDGGLAAGPTLVRDGESRFAVATQVITNHLVAASRDAAGDGVGFVPTSNLACRRELIRAVPFDERYPLAAGEDRAWCAQVPAHGARIAFVDEARVWHHPDLGWRGFWRQHVRYGRGAHRFHTHREGPRLQPLAFYTGMLRAAFTRGIDVGCLVLTAQVATAWGIVREMRAARRG